MNVKISSGSAPIKPSLFKTIPLSSILSAERRDQFLNLGELSDLSIYFKLSLQRLDIVKTISNNANFIISSTADRIFVGGSPLSFLERPQASVTLTAEEASSTADQLFNRKVSTNFLQNLFNSGIDIPAGFRPINIVRYGNVRMKKSMRDLDWFLRYLSYAIIIGDPNILTVNIRGLKNLINSACPSTALLVALKQMQSTTVSLFKYNIESQDLVFMYFNKLILEFESSNSNDRIRKSFDLSLQGLQLPDVYFQSFNQPFKFVMKSNLSNDEKNAIIKACYRQIFERDIQKAYGLGISPLESKVRNGEISLKEFIRSLAKSTLYRKNFYEGFVNSRVVELAFRHLLGRGLSSLEEFRKYFSILSINGLSSLIDSIINSNEYSDYFGEETVPYLRSLGSEAQECNNWGVKLSLFNYSAPFRKIPQFITLFKDYSNPLPNQHPYGILNDPLNIQFGAIFKNPYIGLNFHPAFISRNVRRILIHKGPGIFNQLNYKNTINEKSLNIKNIIMNDGKTSISKILNATYLRIFGRYIYSEEKVALISLEEEFSRKLLTVREFVRQLAKSEIFRSLYWSKFYICKSIEYIHIRILGRPTYGRSELNHYFDIAYKQGFYGFIDSLIDSTEYKNVFGDHVIPYERYITSSNFALSNFKNASNLKNNLYKLTTKKLDKFVQLAEIQSNRSLVSIKKILKQGVPRKRDQIVTFEVSNYNDLNQLITIFRASLQQVFERDINPYIIGPEFETIKNSFLEGKLTVKNLIEQLGKSKLYISQFYTPYPNTQVIDYCIKHFLGRAPKNQLEIRYYNQILSSFGIVKVISTIINSSEYEVLFGENTVPFRRFPTLPAANFPNTQKLYNKQTKQKTTSIAPSLSKFVGVE
uniref:Phycobiliprotein ApcE n=1 Tax=Cyanidium sp. THAL103 TaxID=3027999 RepID=A0A9Y1MY76_9RHOD|nr:phycobillisome linker protein [Cyanidium sp. THAL103]